MALSESSPHFANATDSRQRSLARRESSSLSNDNLASHTWLAASATRFGSKLRTLRMFSLIVASMTLFSTGVIAQDSTLEVEQYLAPPQPILDQVTQPWQENTTLSNISPDGKKFLVAKDEGMVPLEIMARPYVTLGETSIDHIALRSRSLTTRSDQSMRLYFHEEDRWVDVQVPEGARVSTAKWSPDGASFAFFAHYPDSTYIYVCDCETGETRRVCDMPVLATHVTSFDWSLQGDKIVAVLVPAEVDAPTPADVATAPKVRVARPGNRPSRTYRFLLDNLDDQSLLEFVSTGQLATIQVADGTMETVGEPKMYTQLDGSPKADAFRSTTMVQPFSYYSPTRSFGSSDDILGADGAVLHNMSSRKLDQPSRGRGRAGRGGQGRGNFGRGGADSEAEPNEEKRSIEWRPDGAGLSFLQIAPKPEEKKEESKSDNDVQKDDDADDDDMQDTPAADGAKTDGAKTDGADAPQADDADDDTAARGRGGRSGRGQRAPKRKDRVMLWKAPFGDDDVEVVYESEEAIQRVQYSEDCKTIFLTQRIDNRQTITAVHLDHPEQSHVIFRAEPPRNANSNGGDATAGRGGPRPPRPTPQDDNAPADDDKADGDNANGDKADDEPKKERQVISEGSLMTRTTAAGDSVVRISANGEVFFSGSVEVDEEEESDDDADDDDSEETEVELPKFFIDRVGIEAGEVNRIFESDGAMLERLVAVSGDDMKQLFFSRELSDVVPDTFRYDVETKEWKQLTSNKNYSPWYQDLVIERFQVERVDGFKFWVKVYHNPDFGQKLPAMFWFYPREYNDQEAYDRSANSATSPTRVHRFQQPSTRSMVHLTQIGYVVVEPDCPIVGDDGEWNDNYVPDLRNNLWAVVDALDKKQMIDRDRLAIGGHSYGAFGTANALAHTPFFKAGIAGDGNYNRTLTPMSFQREPRSLWNAREVYTQMSPIFFADQIHGALLMYHGIDDANVGTWPINSERMFQALDGTGKPASLYMYPYEGHGPIGRETQLDMWARWIEWLDIYVKHPEKGRELEEARRKALEPDDDDDDDNDDSDD